MSRRRKKIVIEIKQPKKRMPKDNCRSTVFADRREKRKKTRQAKQSWLLAEYS